MKSLILAASVAIACVSAGEAMAGCVTGRIVSSTELKTLVTGNTLCVPAVTVATMTYQELHVANGDIVDYKRGPGHPVDPTAKVGTWTITSVPGGGGAVLNKKYGNHNFSYAVYNNGNGTHSFCAANQAEIVGRVKTGGGAC